MFNMIFDVHVNINGIRYDVRQGTTCVLKGG
jgi:hypothetical protein